MSRYTVLFDANVLYPAPLRDILLQIAASGVVRARWSERIHQEWTGALLRDRKDLSQDRLERTRDKMNAAVPDAVVADFESLESSLVMINEKDRHVLAAAIVGRCDAIVTSNLKDFPEGALEPFNIQALSPDEFICLQISLTPGIVCGAVDEIRKRLNPPQKLNEYAAKLSDHGLPKAAEEIRATC